VSARPCGGTVRWTGVGVWIVTASGVLAVERMSTAIATNAGAETLDGLSTPELPSTKFAGIRAVVAPPAGLPRAAPLPPLEPPGRPAPPEEGAPDGVLEPLADPDGVWLVAVAALEDEDVEVDGGVVVCELETAVVDCELVWCELLPQPAIRTGATARKMNRLK
jgi:hypothetical protein